MGVVLGILRVFWGWFNVFWGVSMDYLVHLLGRLADTLQVSCQFLLHWSFWLVLWSCVSQVVPGCWFWKIFFLLLLMPGKSSASWLWPPSCFCTPSGFIQILTIFAPVRHYTIIDYWVWCNIHWRISIVTGVVAGDEGVVYHVTGASSWYWLTVGQGLLFL